MELIVKDRWNTEDFQKFLFRTGSVISMHRHFDPKKKKWSKWEKSPSATSQLLAMLNNGNQLPSTQVYDCFLPKVEDMPPEGSHEWANVLWKAYMRSKDVKKIEVTKEDYKIFSEWGKTKSLDKKTLGLCRLYNRWDWLETLSNAALAYKQVLNEYKYLSK